MDEQRQKPRPKEKPAPRNTPSAVEGKDKLRGPEDMDQPGAGPRQRSE